MSERFTPYALPDGGHGVWDHKHDHRLEQPGLANVYWFANQALAEMWIDRQKVPTSTDTSPGTAEGQAEAGAHTPELSGQQRASR
ncbi:hypothetical protein [Kitasatospora sp. NPDC005751]|uniref:hypothetical protein n=1 Tax=Kitasatospora sp. NPDC005751 TaxID=3157064 RepID=UPI0034015F62